jgi:hypothetical protein
VFGGQSESALAALQMQERVRPCIEIRGTAEVVTGTCAYRAFSVMVNL